MLTPVIHFNKIIFIKMNNWYYFRLHFSYNQLGGNIMKRISLNEISELLDNESPLAIKEKLLRYKQEGILFFHGSICNKEWDKPFEIYYAETPGKIRYRNAFPITLSNWWQLLRHPNPWQILNDYYYAYFNTTKMTKKWSGPIYIYRGNHFFWIYVKD